MQERRISNTAAVVIAAAVLAGLAAPTPAQAQTSPAPVNDMQRALESRTKGDDSATVVVFEIADFQCPYCAQFAADVAPELHEKYVTSGQVQWVFVNLPMHNHPLAWHAAEAALCAGAAGDGFWPMHDRLFAEQEEWAGSDDPQAMFAGYAADLGIPADAFQACTREDRVASLIIQDLGSAISAGITGTPTFIIMKDEQVVNRLVGVKSVEEWSEALEGALAGDAGGP
jgi:protein-disulfide isomerase